MAWQEFDVKAAHRRLTATCREQQHESFARQTSRRQQLIGRTMMPNGILGVGGAVNLRTSTSRWQMLTSGYHTVKASRRHKHVMPIITERRLRSCSIV